MPSSYVHLLLGTTIFTFLKIFPDFYVITNKNSAYFSLLNIKASLYSLLRFAFFI